MFRAPLLALVLTLPSAYGGFPPPVLGTPWAVPFWPLPDPLCPRKILKMVGRDSGAVVLIRDIFLYLHDLQKGRPDSS